MLIHFNIGPIIWANPGFVSLTMAQPHVTDLVITCNFFYRHYTPTPYTINRSIAGYNPYNLSILTIYYSMNFKTNKVLTVGHTSMFVVKFIVIEINVCRMDLLIRTVVGFEHVCVHSVLIHLCWLSVQGKNAL